MSDYTLPICDLFWLFWEYFLLLPHLVPKEQLYNMKELSSSTYFDKTLCNMVVLKAGHFWLFWLKITSGTFFKKSADGPFLTII